MQDLSSLLDENRDFRVDNLDETIPIEHVIAVCDEIAMIDHRSPGDLRMLIVKVIPQTGADFPYDNKVPQDRVLNTRISANVLPSLRMRIPYSLSMADEVVQKRWNPSVVHAAV